MKVLKIFLKLKAKEIWADGVPAKVIGVIIAWYCIGVWLFGEYIFEPFIIPFIQKTTYTIVDKYFAAPVCLTIIMSIILILLVAILHICDEISEWLRSNWQEAKGIVKKEEEKLNDR